MIPTYLIQNALSLTGENIKKWEYLDIETGYYPSGVPDNKKKIAISLPRFCYYLLSPEFIEKYKTIIEDAWYDSTIFLMFGEAIYEYQKNNPEPLILLLSKIGKK